MSTETHVVDESVHRLIVKVSDGDLRIVPSSDGAASVVLDGPRADEVVVDVTAGVLTVRQPAEEGRRWLSGGGLRITVAAPEGIDVDVKSASLDLLADMAVGDVVVATASGDVRLGSIGSLRAKTASGDIQVESADALRAAVASGDIRVGDVDGDLEVTAASGDVRATSAGGRVEVRTASGDVRIGTWTGTDLAVKTVSGDVAVTVPVGTRAQLDLKTLSGSVVMPDGPSPDVPEESRVVRTLKFTSVSGDFRLGVA